MNADITKMVLVPVDGSDNALQALDYLALLFGPAHPLTITPFYVLPALPPILVEESRKDPETARALNEMDKRNRQMAGRVLDQARERLLEKGFPAERIVPVQQAREGHIAHDICRAAERKRADAIALSTRGRSRLLAFFMGETANKVLEARRDCPAWLIKGRVKRRRVLLAVDPSENARRAVDRAGFMLAGTDVAVTLFHTKRRLQRFVPTELLEGSPELESLWSNAAGKEIAPLLDRAREMLAAAGLEPGQIDVKVVEGSRSPASDILQEMRRGGYGTVVMGRRGASDTEDFVLGSVVKKVIEDLSDAAAWVVD